MKSFTVVATLLAGAAPALAQDKELFFDAPPGVNDLDRIKAAKALAARCVACGIKEAAADTVRPSPNEAKRIRLTAPDRFWGDNIPLVDFLASFLCRTVEIRFERVLKKRERSEFKEGEKAPEGTSWVKVTHWEFVAAPFPRYERKESGTQFLFQDKPKDLAGPFKIHRHSGGDLFGSDHEASVFMLFRGPQAKALRSNIVKNPDDPKAEMIPMYLFIDGAYLPTEKGMMIWRTIEEKGAKLDLSLWRFEGLDSKAPLAMLIENPLPFELKRVKP